MLKSRLKKLTLLGLLPLLFTACKTEVRELKPDELATLNKPGTVMVLATHKTEIAVPDYTLDKQRFEALVMETARKIDRGLITSPAQGWANVVQELFNQPLKYFKPTQNVIQKPAEVTSQGSGFIVNENGYVVTNAHVISKEGDNLKAALARGALEKIAVANCQDFMSKMDSDVQEMLAQTIGTKELFKLCLNGSYAYYANYMQLGEIETNVRTLLSTANPQSEQEGYISDIKAEGKAVPGKDVAILKIEADNLPTVNLADNNTIGTGDTTFALGYPAVADIAKGKPIEASLTSGLISAKKTMPDGWSVLQTDAAISHGSSGGPVFNKAGEVVGVATFGSVDPETGQTVQGINFVVPINIVQEFLAQANVESEEGRLSQLYREGIQLMAQKRYRAALQKFQEVQNLNSKFPYVQQQISEAQKELAEHPETNLVMVGGIAGGTLASGGILYLLARRLRRSRLQKSVVPHS